MKRSNGNVVLSARKYDNNSIGMERMWKETQSVAERIGLPMVYAMESSGIYHVELLAFPNEKHAAAYCTNPLQLRGERRES